MEDESQLWQTFTGQPTSHSQGLAWLQAFAPEDRARLISLWREAITSQSGYEMTCRIQCFDQTYRAYQIQSIPVLGPDQHIVEWIFAGRDITEQKWQDASELQAMIEKAILSPISVASLETSSDTHDLLPTVRLIADLAMERETLLHAQAQAQDSEQALRAANQRMNEFLSIASHEMKTPLTTIKAGIQLAQRRLISCLQESAVEDPVLQNKLAEIQEILECTERPVNIQNRLVSDLLEAARIQSDRLTLHLKPCNLVTIVLEAVEDLRTMNTQRLFRLHLPATEIVPIMADADRIRQVISNYLINAHKYSPIDSPIEVELTVEEQQARLAIRDEGPGLSSEEQERVWERFYRVQWNEEQQSNGVGLGLGLHICQTIVQQHQGHIGVESTPGDGSTFWFTLPLLPQSANS